LAIKRKARRVGTSLVVSLPSHVCQAFDIKAGDDIEIIATESRMIMYKSKSVDENEKT